MKEDEKGNCFESAFQALNTFGPEWVLVHGIVVGTGGITQGRCFCHAWIELPENGVVVDTERERPIPMEQFYRVGRIEVTAKYYWEASRSMAQQSGTYGPWDERILALDESDEIEAMAKASSSPDSE